MNAPRVRGRPRRPELTDEIANAALRLIAVRGFDAVSMEDIASACGVGKPAIYRRWSGKADLVVDALRRRLDRAPDPPDTGGLHTDLAAFYGTYLTELAAEDLLPTHMAALIPAHPEPAATMREVAREFTRRHADTILQRAVRRGELEPGAVDHFVFEAAEALLVGRTAVTGAPPEPWFVLRAVQELLIPALPVRAGGHGTGGVAVPSTEPRPSASPAR